MASVIRAFGIVALLIPLGFPGAVFSAEKTFELAIADRKLAGPQKVIRVKQGERITIRWTTDERATLHLHGYDLEVTVTPDAPATLDFTARATGRFPITVHRFGEQTHPTGDKQGAGHGHGHEEEVTLIYLEVLPK